MPCVPYNLCERSRQILLYLILGLVVARLLQFGASLRNLEVNMTIALTPDQEQFIQNKLSSGQYGSAAEVIAEALRLLERRDRGYEAWLSQTREQVNVAQAELARCEGIEGHQVIERLREKSRQLKHN
jgi:antitoxin ParD1/3/4